MRYVRLLFAAITLTGVGLVAAGCAGPGPVVKELPPPYHEPVSIKPSRPVPPTPAPAPASDSIAGKTIVVDPGHGGADPGALAQWGGANEKTIVLAVAQEVARGLREAGAKVVTTRDRDVFIELDDRAALAESTHADLFVSIHADACKPNPQASGATVYIARNASPQSLRAALRLETAFKRAGIETRGIERAGFRVLVGHSRPAVLIECGFLTNRADSQHLNTASYRSKLASVIVAGIADYFSR